MSFNELTIVKCINIKLKGSKNLSFLHNLNDLSQEMQIDNLNIILKLWGFIEDKQSHFITKLLF